MMFNVESPQRKIMNPYKLLIPHHRWTRAILVACAIEGVLAVCFAFAGFGPCGPSNALGMVALLGHLPAMFVFGFLGMPEHTPEPVQVMVGLLVQVGFFTLAIRTFAWTTKRID
jgi:hypothetical protein